MKQFLLHLDEKNKLGKKFILQDLDETHVFIEPEILDVLREKINDLMDQNAFSVVGQQWSQSKKMLATPLSLIQASMSSSI